MRTKISTQGNYENCALQADGPAPCALLAEGREKAEAHLQKADMEHRPGSSASLRVLWSEVWMGRGRCLHAGSVPEGKP